VEILNKWLKEINDISSDIYRQSRETEEYNKTLPEEIKNGSYVLNPGAFLTSKPINTKQITEHLSKLYGTTDLDLSISSLNIEQEEEEPKVSEAMRERDELMEQLEKEKGNFAKLQQELVNSQNKIQELENKITELEIQIPPK
jgi:hypothetical protein